MKKNYIAPSINVVKIQSTLLTGSGNEVSVDPNTGTTTQGSRFNTIDFTDDDDDYAGNW